MFDKMIYLCLVLILVCVGYGVSQYKGPAPVSYDNEVIRAQDGHLVACPTAEELDAVEWTCKTDSECDAEYKALYSVNPWECGDQA